MTFVKSIVPILFFLLLFVASTGVVDASNTEYWCGSYWSYSPCTYPYYQNWNSYPQNYNYANYSPYSYAYPYSYNYPYNNNYSYPQQNQNGYWGTCYAAASGVGGYYSYPCWQSYPYQQYGYNYNNYGYGYPYGGYYR